MNTALQQHNQVQEWHKGLIILCQGKTLKDYMEDWRKIPIQRPYYEWFDREANHQTVEQRSKLLNDLKDKLNENN